MRQDLREANTRKVKDAIKTGRGLKKCTPGAGRKALIQFPIPMYNTHLSFSVSFRGENYALCSRNYGS